MLRQEDRFLYFSQEELIEKQQWQCWKYIFKEELDFVFCCFGWFVLCLETQPCDVALMVSSTDVQCIRNTWLLTQSTA